MYVFNFGTLSTPNDSNEIPHGRVVNHGKKMFAGLSPRAAFPLQPHNFIFFTFSYSPHVCE